MVAVDVPHGTLPASHSREDSGEREEAHRRVEGRVQAAREDGSDVPVELRGADEDGEGYLARDRA